MLEDHFTWLNFNGVCFFWEAGILGSVLGIVPAFVFYGPSLDCNSSQNLVMYIMNFLRVKMPVKSRLSLNFEYDDGRKADGTRESSFTGRFAGSER